MRILVCHNYYRSSAPSGEDAVAENEISMLREYGHEVITYCKYNDDLDASSLTKKLSIAKNTVWSKSTYYELTSLLKKNRPDIVHFHSIFPQLSPSAYKACFDVNIPVIHTLHNFRSVCPGALLLRDGKICELCLHGSILNSLIHKCYRDSILATGALTSMISYNRLIGAFTKYVSQYISLTEFAASRLIMGKIPKELITVKPNFLPVLPSPGTGSGGYAVYVGRLSIEKGVKTLFSAWKDIDMELKVIGDGPLMDELKSLPAENLKQITFYGYLERQKILEIVRDAVIQIVPSECYEGFPMVLLEAFSCGTPVIGSDIGSIGEIVVENETGMKFESGNVESLKSTILKALSNQEKLKSIRRSARNAFDRKYSKEISYNILLDIYTKSLVKAKNNSYLQPN